MVLVLVLSKQKIWGFLVCNGIGIVLQAATAAIRAATAAPAATAALFQWVASRGNPRSFFEFAFSEFLFGNALAMGLAETIRGSVTL